MNMLMWIVILLLLGFGTGKIVGTLTAFTHGPVVYDLLAGGIGAITAGVLVQSIGPLSFRAPLMTLLTGAGVAFLSTWLIRIATWPAEPRLQPPEDTSSHAATGRQRHDVMTTGEASTMLLTRGRLVAPRT